MVAGMLWRESPRRKPACIVLTLALLASVVTLTGGWRRPAVATGEVRPAGNVPTSAEINGVLQELAGITGFEIRKQLPFALISREQVNEYLKEQIRQTVKPDEIRAEEVTLKKFGFVPDDFNLRQTTIDLLTEQAAAFYDFHRKKLFISDWAVVNMRDAALIHELAHALADQTFSIRKFVGKTSDNGEASLAREAVVEGQASWLMLEVDARRKGQSLSDPRIAQELLRGNSDSDDTVYPVFSQAPLYLRKTLLFPYEDGERFQQAVFLRNGMAAFAGILRDAPVSTAQILHPERYFDHLAPAGPVLPKPLAGTKAFVTGELGELETRILLQQYGTVALAETLGPKLKSSAYRVDESRKDHRMTLIYLSEWSEAASAASYFAAYQNVLRRKWKRLEVTAGAGNRFAGKSEDGYFEVLLNGTRVQSKEGFALPF